MSLRLVLLVALLAGLASCHRVAQPLSFAGPTMGTAYAVKIVRLPSGITEQQIRASIEAVLARIDRSMSGYRADSEISRFNAAASTDWIEISSELAYVVATALEVGERSGGVLDITVAPLVDVWGFGPAGPRSDVPALEAIQQAQAHVGLSKLAVRSSPPALRKADPALTVDLNAVAPGYAVDLLAEEFGRLGLTDFMIDIGGEVRVRGHNAQGRRWRVAVEKPLDGEPQPYAILELTDCAVTTSGEYRHFDVRDGKRYSHTIDPRTGRPIEHDLAAVVVVSSTALLADAWATAFNVLGAADGYALAEQRRMPALFITMREGQWVKRATPGFESYLAPEPVSKDR